jgi:hypothetical protein
MKGDIKVAGKDLPLRTIVQLNQVTFGMRLDFHLAACFSSCFKCVRPDTISLFSSVSPLATCPKTKSKRLASLTKLAMIAVLELLEYAHGALNSGRRDDFFDRIGHDRNNYGLKLCSNIRLAGAISGSYLQKRSPSSRFLWRPRALHPSNDGDALIGKRARLAPDAFPSARLLFQFFRPTTLKAVDYVAWQFC